MKRMLGRLLQPVSIHADAAAVLPLWSRVRSTSRRWLRRMDWPGALAIGILVMCPAFYFSAILPGNSVPVRKQC